MRSKARFGCPGRRWCSATGRAMRSVSCNPVEFDDFGIITSWKWKGFLRALDPSQTRRKASSSSASSRWPRVSTIMAVDAVELAKIVEMTKDPLQPGLERVIVGIERLPVTRGIRELVDDNGDHCGGESFHLSGKSVEKALAKRLPEQKEKVSGRFPNLMLVQHHLVVSPELELE